MCPPGFGLQQNLSPFTEPSSNSLNEGSPRRVPLAKGPKTKEPLRNTPKGYPYEGIPLRDTPKP